MISSINGIPLIVSDNVLEETNTPRRVHEDARYAFDDFGIDSREFKAEAKKELKFLQSLIPVKR